MFFLFHSHPHSSNNNSPVNECMGQGIGGLSTHTKPGRLVSLMEIRTQNQTQNPSVAHGQFSYIAIHTLSCTTHSPDRSNVNQRNVFFSLYVVWLLLFLWGSPAPKIVFQLLARSSNRALGFFSCIFVYSHIDLDVHTITFMSASSPDKLAPFCN